MTNNNKKTTDKRKITSSFLFLTIISILVLLLQHIPTCLSQAEDQTQQKLRQWYNSCGSLYTCGNKITNISYPFWGGTRSKNCGHPSLQLQCNSTTNTTILQIEKIQYQVLDINANDTALKISRLDLQAANTCPTTFTDTTLDYTILDYASGYTNITILYGCPLLPVPAADDGYGATGASSITPHVPFNCSVEGTELSNAYVVSSAIGTEVMNASGCSHSVVVPIEGNLEKILVSDSGGGNFSLKESIEEGFEAVYKVDNAACIACGATDGRCGYDLSKDVTICICPDGSLADSDNHTCGNTGSGDDAATTGSKSSNSKTVVIGVSVGAAAIAASILLCAYLFFQQRKKKRLQASNAAAGKNKDINSTAATGYTFNSRGVLQSTNGTLQSSSGYTTTPTTYSQSTSSYVSSRSDLERGGRDDSSYYGVRLFSYEELEQATSHFDEARELGDGGFGTVYYGKLPDGCLVAVKRLYENSFKRVEQFMNEVQILARLRHKNLVTLYGCTSRRSRELLLVYEYISNGTVADHIHGRLASSDSTKNNQHHLPWLTRLNIAVETAEALAFLHKSDVIHRDVKTTNILLDQNFCVKVADFGLSRLFPTDVTHVSTAPQGTPGYVDPEYYQCYRLTEKSDVYSFGVVLIELISSKQAVDITRHRHHINLSNMAVDKIQNHQLNELVDPNLGFKNDCTVERMVKGVAELAFRCLQQERDMRPTMGEVLDTLRLIQKHAVEKDQKVLQEVIVVDKSGIVCTEDEDVELLKNVPPPFSPEGSKDGSPTI